VGVFSLPVACRAQRTALLGLVAPLLALATTVAAPGQARAVGGSDLVAVANTYRVSQSLSPVSFQSQVDQIAVERGLQMAGSDRLEHNLAYVEKRLRDFGLCWQSYGEIIAWESGQPTQSSERTVKQWWDSPAHRSIMLGSFNVAGGSYAVSNSAKRYSVMIFVSLCGSDTPTLAGAVPIFSGRVNYSPARRLGFAAGTYTGFKFNDSGLVVARKSATLAAPSGASASARMYTNGNPYFRIIDGIWAGYWVRDTASVWQK